MASCAVLMSTPDLLAYPCSQFDAYCRWDEVAFQLFLAGNMAVSAGRPHWRLLDCHVRGGGRQGSCTEDVVQGCAQTPGRQHFFCRYFPVISPAFSEVSLPNGTSAHLHVGEETSPPLWIVFQYSVFLAGHLSAAFRWYFPQVWQCNVVLGKPAAHPPLEAKKQALQPFELICAIDNTQLFCELDDDP